jgi:MYXO-CTERM domain-containing protein
MRLVRSQFVVFVSAFACAFALTMGSAFAAGSLTYAKKEIQESSGQWHLMMTIIYGGKPVTAHVPMRFTFVPTAILENYLDDAHGDKPQKRKIPLVGQTPMQESVDVDFSDTRGKLFDRTRFDFNISRSHNFVAGDYAVTVHRADGAQVGTTQTLVLLGDNPVIDRRTISFVGQKKDKPAAAAAADAPGDAKTAPAGTPPASDQPAAAPAADTPPASAAETPPEDAPDPAAAAKVPPAAHGCGCRLAQNQATRGMSALVALGLVGTAALRLRRRRLRSDAPKAARSQSQPVRPRTGSTD